MKEGPTHLYRAAAVRDALGTDHRPGYVAVRGGRILATGPLSRLKTERFDDAAAIDLPRSLILPAMVNAHAHLDLTDLGPRPFGGDFVHWLRSVRELRPSDPAAVESAVRRGMALSRQQGVCWVGDIAGSDAALRARLRAALDSPERATPGVSYIECFGLGDRQTEALAWVRRQLDATPYETVVPSAVPFARGVLPGIAPHSPYSAGLELYDASARLSQEKLYRLSTHLAESDEELRFIAAADGPLADLLRQIGRWDDTIRPTGKHPVEWLDPALRHGRWLLAHCNHVRSDEHIRILARRGASVAYCPLATDYFRHLPGDLTDPDHPDHPEHHGRHHPDRPRHAYLDMLDAGVNVCLGTDSILCQPADEPQPMSILAPMRYLYRRDRHRGLDPAALLRMATVNGMIALELHESVASLRPGAPAHLYAIDIGHADPATDPGIDAGTDPLERALLNRQPIRPVPTA